MQLIRQAEPRHVVLVHGDKAKMGFLKQKIMKEFGTPCFDPANGTTVSLPTSQAVSVDISVNLLKRTLEPSDAEQDGERAGKFPSSLHYFCLERHHDNAILRDSQEGQEQDSTAGDLSDAGG